MPDLTQWNRLSAINAAHRASRAWGRIQRDPTTITLIRDGTPGSAQTVRLEFDSGAGRFGEQSRVGRGTKRTLVIFGVRDHPTVADTDIERSDMFTIVTGGTRTQYEVKDVIFPPGEVQARAEALQ